MEKEDILKFSNTIILLSKLLTKISDDFLSQKLHKKITNFIFEFVEYKKTSDRKSDYPHVAQIGFHNANSVAKSDDIVQRGMSNNIVPKDLINSINGTTDYIEYLIHLSKKETTPLLHLSSLFLAQRNLLKFKLYILRDNKKKQAVKDIIVLPKNQQEVVVSTAAVAGDYTKMAIDRPEIKLNPNKERIYNCIKKSPNIRTKDILNEFGSLSGRTVKRSLKELTDEGLLKKRVEGAAVYYLAIRK